MTLFPMVSTPGLVESATHEIQINFPNIMKNDEKSMFVKATQDILGDTRESLEMLWSVPESSRMIPDDF